MFQKSKYIFVFFLFLSFLLLTNNFHAEEIIWKNTTSRILDCKLIDSLNFIIVGDDGKIIKSTDGGNNWEWCETGIRKIFFSVDFLDLNKGIVVGDSGVFAITTNSGKTWRTGFIGKSRLYAVKIIDNNEILVISEDGIVYKSYNFANSWLKVYQTNDEVQKKWFLNNEKKFNAYYYFYHCGFSFINENIGFAIGLGPNILKTTNRGDTWEIVLRNSDTTMFSMIDFYDENYGIATGGDFFYDDSLHYYHFKTNIKFTSNSGNSWKKLEVPEKNILYTVIKMIDNKNILAYGGYGISIYSIDAGLHWSKKYHIDYKYFKDNTIIDSYHDTIAALGERYKITSMSFDNNGNYLAIDVRGAILISIDTGKTLKTLKNYENNPDYNYGIIDNYGLKKLTKKSIICYGQYSRVLFSQDNGISWDKVFPRIVINNSEDALKYGTITSHLNPSYFNFHHFIDEKNGFLSGSKEGLENKNTIFTSDGGLTWKIQDKINSINGAFYTNKNGFVITSNKYHKFFLLKTNDGGYHWDTVKTYDNNEDLIQLFIIDKSNSYLKKIFWNVPTKDTINFPNGYKHITIFYKSDDLFTSLDSIRTIISKNSSDYFNNMEIINKDTIFLYGSSGERVILKSTDGLKTFEELLLPGNSHIINDLKFINSKFGIACGINDTLFYTYNGGISWMIKDLHFNRSYWSNDTTYKYSFNKIISTNNNELFLIGKGRVVRGIIDSTGTGVDDKNTEGGVYCPYYYITVVPNPVINNVKINLYGLHYAQNQKLSLKIYDINGYFVKDLSQEANRNNNGKTGEFRTDLSDLPAGIYFIQMEANNLIRSQKFIKY